MANSNDLLIVRSNALLVLTEAQAQVARLQDMIEILNRVLSTQEALPTPQPRTDYEARFWSKVQITENHWYWQGAMTGTPQRPVFTKGSMIQYAHRVAWELDTKMPLSDNLKNMCGENRCVRPSHHKVSKRGRRSGIAGSTAKTGWFRSSALGTSPQMQISSAPASLTPTLSPTSSEPATSTSDHPAYTPEWDWDQQEPQASDPTEVLTEYGESAAALQAFEERPEGLDTSESRGHPAAESSTSDDPPPSSPAPASPAQESIAALLQELDEVLASRLPTS